MPPLTVNSHLGQPLLILPGEKGADLGEGGQGVRESCTYPIQAGLRLLLYSLPQLCPFPRAGRVAIVTKGFNPFIPVGLFEFGFHYSCRLCGGKVSLGCSCKVPPSCAPHSRSFPSTALITSFSFLRPFSPPTMNKSM